MINTSDIRAALRGNTAPAKSTVKFEYAEGFTEELRQFAQLRTPEGEAVTDETLNEYKRAVESARSEDMAELSHVRAELREVSRPYNSRIKQLKTLIQGEEKLLGIKRIKRASKVEILSQQEVELKNEIALLKAQLAAATKAGK